MAANYSHPVTPSLTDVADNTWVLVNQGSVTAPGGIMSYSGGWYDPQNHQFCIFGGGHWDYSGNEVWCFDIATLTWNELYAPDVVTRQGQDQGAYNNYDNNRYPGALFNPAGESIENANPVSKHTYDQMEYVDGLGPVIWGGYSWGDGSTTGWCVNCKDTWAFNFTSADWQYLYDGTNPSPNARAGVGASAYSFDDNLLFVLAFANTWTFNPVNNRWTQINTTGTAPYAIEMTMEYDSKRNALYTFGGRFPDNPNLHRFDIATRTWTLLSPSGIGPDASTVRGPGMAYDETNDVLLVYKTGNIWAYDPNANSWTQYSPASRPMSDLWDPYGRFRYDPINNGAWLHTMQNGQHTTWFYRYRSGNLPPPPEVGPAVIFNASPMAITTNGQTVLTWTSDADGCTASGDWSDPVSPNGSVAKMLISTSIFTLTCVNNAGGQTIRYVTVQVSDPNNPPPPNTDTDSDGLPDLWEQQYFGDLLSSATDDNDQDGFNNLQEYNSGSDPTVFNSNNDIVQITITNLASSDQINVPITLGHVFKPGDVPSGTSLGAKLADATEIPLQVNSKATHADGSLRHAILTARLPDLANAAVVPITFFQKNNTLTGSAISLPQLLATSFDATVSLDIGGTVYSASARDLLQNSPSIDWLSGPIVSEWVVNAAVRTTGGTPHPHLTAHFAIRAYDGIDRVRVSVTIENSTLLVDNAQRYDYDASVSINGQGVVFSQSAVPHYRQGRWHRIFWWGNNPQVHITHDKPYFELTRAIPTYDPKVTVPDFRLDEWLSLYNQNSGLMEFGLIDTYMPGGGGRARGDIAPLPGWTATWLLSQDPRAKTYMLGTDEQAATFNVHFRDESTGYPIRATDHPNWQAYVRDDGGNYYPPGLNSGFPSSAKADTSHQPDIAYVPYLITGDYFYLEEMQFWASWNIMNSGKRGGANGYVVWDQVRGQAWSLRSVAHAAYATPDAHPLKSYYQAILENNRLLMENKWLNTQSSEFRWPAIGVNPLGYITNEDWLGITYTMSSWMDDFLTWSVGHIVALGFTDWAAFRDYKVQFPVGRTIDPVSCWVLASSYWPDILDTYPGGANTGSPVNSWQTWNEALSYTSRGAFFNSSGFRINFTDNEQAFLATDCASIEMYGYLPGISQGEMAGYTSPDSYMANLQSALAVSVEAGYPNAQSAYDQVQLATNLPDYTATGRPAWALAPYTGSQGMPGVPSILLSANPTTVAMNGTTTLSWFVSNATSCTASGSWSGAQATSGGSQQSGLNSDSTYTLSCTGAGGTTSRAVTVTVSAAPPPPPAQPSISFLANPLMVAMNGSTTLTWSVSNATACTASGSWSGDQNTDGSMQQLGLSSDSIYTLSCTGAGGTTSRSVNVSIDTSGGSSSGGDDESGAAGSLNALALLGLLFLALRRRFKVQCRVDPID